MIVLYRSSGATDAGMVGRDMERLLSHITRIFCLIRMLHVSYSCHNTIYVVSDIYQSSPHTYNNSVGFQRSLLHLL